MTTDIELPQGTVTVRDEGTGPPIVFVHGLLVDGTVWRRVVPLLTDRARCLVPDLPLGAHRRPLRAGADLTPPGLARLVADVLEALDLRDVTLVANDTGGAIAQLVVTRHPERVGRLVLTNCDCFENFLPPFFMPMVHVGARVPGALAALGALMRAVPPLRRLPNAYGGLTQRPIPHDVIEGWLEGGRDRDVRRDTRAVLRGIDKRYTLDAAAALPGFDRPALLAWGTEDRFFPLEHAHRLAALLPDARVVPVEDAKTFVSEDRPERLAALIAEHVGLDAVAPLAPAASR